MMKAIQIKSRFEHADKNKGYERTYYFYDEEGVICWSCDIYGECLKAPTIYISVSDDNQAFAMIAKGKFLNATYYLENKQGLRFATITRKGIGFRWKILDENDREIARVIDSTSRKEAFFRELFSALPDGYAVVLGDKLIATIKSDKLSQKIQQTPRNIFGKMFEKAFEPRGLTLRLELDFLSNFDVRTLLGSMTLLQVHDITGVNRQ